MDGLMPLTSTRKHANKPRFIRQSASAPMPQHPNRHSSSHTYTFILLTRHQSTSPSHPGSALSNPHDITHHSAFIDIPSHLYRHIAAPQDRASRHRSSTTSDNTPSHISALYTPSAPALKMSKDKEVPHEDTDLGQVQAWFDLFSQRDQKVGIPPQKHQHRHHHHPFLHLTNTPYKNPI